MEQQRLPGIEAIDLLTGGARRFAEIRATYPEDRKHTNAWCAWKARGGEEEGRKPNRSDAVMGSRWMQEPAVQREVEKARRAQLDVLSYGGTEVLQDLLRLKDMAFGDAEIRMVTSDKDGVAYSRRVKKTDLAALNRVLETLAKHFRLLEAEAERG